MGRGATVEFAPVGATLENGFDLGGARIYPFSRGLAVTPPAYFSNYIGSGQGLPVAPPASALSGTAGAPLGGGSTLAAQAKSSPFSAKWSPLPWVIGGLLLAVVVMHELHYKDRRRG